MESTYWHDDAPLVLAAALPGAEGLVTQLYGRWHWEAEEVRWSARDWDLLPLTRPQRGTHQRRASVHMQPYLVVSEAERRRIMQQCEAAGLVLGVHVGEPFAERQLGSAQAWYYPADQFIVLWECFLWPPWRGKLVQASQVMADCWRAFEARVVEAWPDATRIATGGTETITTVDDYQAFLRGVGYAPYEEDTWIKTLTTVRA